MWPLKIGLQTNTFHPSTHFDRSKAPSIMIVQIVEVLDNSQNDF